MNHLLQEEGSFEMYQYVLNRAEIPKPPEEEENVLLLATSQSPNSRILRVEDGAGGAGKEGELRKKDGQRKDTKNK